MRSGIVPREVLLESEKFSIESDRAVKVQIETLRLRFFGISREQQTSRSHEIRALPSGLRFEVHVCTARPRSSVRVDFLCRVIFTLLHEILASR